MKKLFDYSKKYGLSITPETYGENYFRNAPPLQFDGAQIVFDIREEQPVTESVFYRFCEKSGYSIIAWGPPGFHVLNVMKAEDRASLDLYNEYMNKSVEACSEQIHLRANGFYSQETDREFDERLSGIMEFWGNEYAAAVADRDRDTPMIELAQAERIKLDPEDLKHHAEPRRDPAEEYTAENHEHDKQIVKNHQIEI